MRITNRQLRRIIRESINEYGRSNQPPEKASNWRAFADDLDIGVLDLDNMAYGLGFRDFRDMDVSISPSRLADRDTQRFTQAARDSSLRAANMSDAEILTVANASGGM
jgi:hypothetical protein